MINSLRANPIIIWIVRRDARPSVSLSLALTVGLWTVNAIFMMTAFQRSPATMSLLNRFLFWAALSVIVGGLPIIILFAAIPIISDARSGRSQLLLLTDVSDEMVIQGYIVIGLHRLRTFLAIIIGLSPALMIGGIHHVLMLRIAHLCLLGIRACESIPPQIGFLQVGTLLALSVLATITIMGMIIMCASFGIWTATRWQQVAPAVASSLVLTGIVGLPLSFILALFMKAIIDLSLRWPDIFTLLSVILATTIIGLTPFPLSERAMRSAQGWIWRERSG